MDIINGILVLLLSIGDITGCVCGVWEFYHGNWQKGTALFVLAISCHLRARHIETY